MNIGETTMTRESIASITDDQKKQYLQFIQDVAERALRAVGLDKDGIQKLIEHSDEFHSRIITSIQELTVGNQFVDEEVKSEYGYLSGYEPKSIVDQIACLHKLFPELGSANVELVNQPLPQNAEGWFAIPRWENIAPTYNPTYNAAVEKVIGFIMQAYHGNFYNYR